MAKGEIRRIDNFNAKFGANSTYLFCKVEEKYSEEEEYWLMTDHQLEIFLDRSIENSEDIPTDLNKGEFRHVTNKHASEQENDFYIAANLELEGEEIDLLLTSHELEVIRERVEDNKEDIEINKENWLFDLFD